MGQGPKAEWSAGPGLWLGSEDCAKGGMALFPVHREPRAASGLYVIAGTLAARRRTASRKKPGAGRPDRGLSEGPGERGRGLSWRGWERGQSEAWHVYAGVWARLRIIMSWPSSHCRHYCMGCSLVGFFPLRYWLQIRNSESCNVAIILVKFLFWFPGRSWDPSPVPPRHPRSTPYPPNSISHPYDNWSTSPTFWSLTVYKIIGAVAL